MPPLVPKHLHTLLSPGSLRAAIALATASWAASNSASALISGPHRLPLPRLHREFGQKCYKQTTSTGLSGATSAATTSPVNPTNSSIVLESQEKDVHISADPETKAEHECAVVRRKRYPYNPNPYAYGWSLSPVNPGEPFEPWLLEDESAKPASEPKPRKKKKKVPFLPFPYTLFIGNSGNPILSEEWCEEYRRLHAEAIADEAVEPERERLVAIGIPETRHAEINPHSSPDNRKPESKIIAPVGVATMSDQDYEKFLEGASGSREQVENKTVGNKDNGFTTKTVDGEIPARLGKVDAIYTSDADEPFEVVSLRFGGGKLDLSRSFFLLVILPAKFPLIS